MILIPWCICLAIDVEDRFLQPHIRLNWSALPKTHLKTLQSDLYFDFEKLEADFRHLGARPESIFWRQMLYFLKFLTHFVAS